MFRNVSVYRRNTLARVGVKGSCRVSANMTARDGTNYQSMMTSSKPRRWPELVMIAELLGRLAMKISRYSRLRYIPEERHTPRTAVTHKAPLRAR